MVFDPLADAVASGLRTLVLAGVLSAVAGLPAAAWARWRRAGSPEWLGVLAGPLVTVHGLNLLFCAVLLVWMVLDAARGVRELPAPSRLALFVASFLVPNLPGLAAWLYVRRRRPAREVPRLVPETGPR